MTLLEELPRGSFHERSIPVLETKRLTLRAPRLEDAKAVAVLANDRRIAENTARIPHPYKLSDAETFIGTANKGEEALFLITMRSGVNKGAIIGACGFVTQEKPVPELGYWLGVEHWGKGYATEALHALVDYMFDTVAGINAAEGKRPENDQFNSDMDRARAQLEIGRASCRERV